MTAIIDLQVVSSEPDLPHLDDFQRWVDKVLAHKGIADQEITIRIVDEMESQTLNREYRGKDKPTNVLSFPFDAPDGIEFDLLGDLVICAGIVRDESSAQNKTLQSHWAHMVIHGTLHLLGYDHIEDAEAEQMESLETRLLHELGIDDPYQDQ